MWYEFYPNQMQLCYGQTTSANASITAVVTNHGGFGGSNTRYTMIVYDITNNTACSVEDGFNLSSPKYGALMKDLM